MTDNLCPAHLPAGAAAAVEAHVTTPRMAETPSDDPATSAHRPPMSSERGVVLR